MDNIEIIKGSPSSKSGARLNMLALDDMTETLVGTMDKNVAEQALAYLWKCRNNRFSYEYVYEAKQNNQTLGLVTCYPAKLMERLAWPTVKQLLEIRKWPLVSYVFKHFGAVWNLMNLREGREDEFHIGTIATLPENHGTGIGTKLLIHAENIAKQNNFEKISLTVKQKNTLAQKLYERMGYEITDKVDKKPFFLFRMVKQLS